MNDVRFIEIEDVTKRYRGAQDLLAVDRISTGVAQGEFISILGPSGCGKSTLMQMLAGLTPCSSGRISVGGREVDGPQTDLGIVFQDTNLLDWRTVLKNVMLQIEIRRLDPTRYRDRARQLLAMVGLEGFADKLPHQLSGGMKQRVAICRALIHDPPLLVMDEPFGALDALTRDQLNVDLQDIWLESRKTVIFVTHSISEAVFLSDRVLVMSPRPGRLAADIRIDLERRRSISVRETPAFGAYVSQIRRMFEDWGVLRRDDDPPVARRAALGQG